MIEIKLNIDVDNLKKRLTERGENIRKGIVRGLDEVARQMQHAAKTYAPRNQGQLAAGIGRTLDAPNLRAYVVARVDHAAYMETGTRPGYGPNAGQPRGAPPVNDILQWVALKLGLPLKEAKGVAFIIARSIGRKGVKPHPFFKPAFEQVAPNATKIVQDHIHQALDVETSVAVR